MKIQKFSRLHWLYLKYYLNDDVSNYHKYHSIKKTIHAHEENSLVSSAEKLIFQKHNVTIHSEIPGLEDPDLCSRRRLISMCERCEARLASITCLDFCFDKICIKCCHYLHSGKKRIHHTPSFIKQDDRNITKNKPSDKHFLKSLCQNTLVLCGRIADESNNNLRKTRISELQKTQGEKRLSNLIEQEEAEKKRLKH